MPQFIINTNNPKALKELEVSKIFITKVISDSTDILTLSSPLKIKQILPDDSFYEYYIHPITYFSNFNPKIATDVKMKEIINNCQYSTISIQNIKTELNFSLTIEYEIVVDFIPELIILKTYQSEGITYSLHPKSKLAILGSFPDAKITDSIYISNSTSMNYNIYHGGTYWMILKTLTGLSDRYEQDIKWRNTIYHIKNVKFINAKNNIEESSVYL